MISHHANGKINPSRDFIEKFIKSFKLTPEEKEIFLFVAELLKTEFLKDMLKSNVRRGILKILLDYRCMVWCLLVMD